MRLRIDESIMQEEVGKLLNKYEDTVDLGESHYLGMPYGESIQNTIGWLTRYESNTLNIE